MSTRRATRLKVAMQKAASKRSSLEFQAALARTASEEAVGSPFRVMFANMAKQASAQLDMFARGSFLDGLMGNPPLSNYSDEPRAAFAEARNALKSGDVESNRLASMLTGHLGLNEQQALRWVSERDLGLYDMLIQGANKMWKGDFHRGIDADGIAASLSAGISPITGELLSYKGKKPASFFWGLGLDALKQRRPRTVSQARGLAFNKGQQAATDIWRGDAKERGMVQLDAPVPRGDIDSSQSLLEILQGEMADDPSSWQMGLGRTILEYQDSFKILDPYVRQELMDPQSEIAGMRVHKNRAQPPTEVEIWETLLDNPDHITVKTTPAKGDKEPARHEVKIEAKDLVKKLLGRRGYPSSHESVRNPPKAWQKRIHDAARKIDRALRSAFRSEEVSREFLQSKEIQDVMKQEMRRRQKNHKVRMVDPRNQRSLRGPKKWREDREYGGLGQTPTRDFDLATPKQLPGGLPALLKKEIREWRQSVESERKRLKDLGPINHRRMPTGPPKKKSPRDTSDIFRTHGGKTFRMPLKDYAKFLVQKGVKPGEELGLYLRDEARLEDADYQDLKDAGAKGARLGSLRTASAARVALQYFLRSR